MLTLGITGGIASGKSTAAALLADLLGTQNVSADAIVAELFQNSRDIQKQLTSAFGQSICDQSGINRAALRDIVFSSPESKKQLEQIVHPRVRQEWLARKDEAQRRKQKFFLVEIPLLFEVNAQDELDYVGVIACSRQVQVQRLVQDRGMREEMARKIIETQMPLEKKINLTDFVIWNDGSRQMLRRQLSELHLLLSERA